MSINKDASFLATTNLRDDSGRSKLSLKLDFRSHPAAVVLSVWARMQSFAAILLWNTSIQMVIMEAINSRVLIWALFVRSNGSCSRQAAPE